MRSCKTLKKWRNNLPAKICCLQHYIPSFIAHAAFYDFDCIWLDLEHRAFDDREVQSLLYQSHLHDIDIMIRPSTLEKSKLYRYLEDGASGLMIPHVSSSEKARTLVNSIKFPPQGDRGIDGAGMDSQFMLQGGYEYTEPANNETFLVVQIETREAVENADEIAAVEGVDSLFIGTGDLGLRINKLGSELNLEQSIIKVAEAANKHGKAWGRPVSGCDDIKHILSQGAKLLPYGGDFTMLKNELERHSKELDACIS
ncbi:MAG: aldolase/citrate lyase family protein [SAR324 cluster bacterium]|jgi:2-keto-3-deoxy-L-rhamnonate aldolase RhmA|nr:aldolase/citrate lyase family protein [SAR324 cluster bacterium]